MISQKQHIIKIPEGISAIYCTKNNILTCAKSDKIKSVKTQTKIFLLPKNNSILISDITVSNKKKVKDTKGKTIQQTTIAEIKLILAQMSNSFHKKLSLIGVGYKVLLSESFSDQLVFKLGFSHPINVKIPTFLKVSCTKSTNLFIYGDCPLNSITQFTAYVRSLKNPEPYKGKGILYDNEKIFLKKGKKI